MKNSNERNGITMRKKVQFRANQLANNNVDSDSTISVRGRIKNNQSYHNKNKRINVGNKIDNEYLTED